MANLDALLTENEWKDALGGEMDRPYMHSLAQYLNERRSAGAVIYPDREDIFAALNITPLSKVRVVILGQDPYHGAGQAHGLAFSVKAGVRPPPSLKNIYKEITAEFDAPGRASGDLTSWAEQGVLLLNTTLTVEDGKPGSHQKRGWEELTDQIIRIVSSRCEHVVFLLWGSHAQKKAALIDKARHLLLEAPHPSPLSAHRGFLGCGHFIKANDYLKSHGLKPVDWLS